ncbi:signal-induced proliferation-associated 1-like protein 2 isoform X2 [Leptopilina heterotoma]|uniref:signal-induced proliferation-associated 1-like protein 2 isoform X2 n=1 Tax=Leptopilina heterotoma TaxID=63436 RepID=UPI001CA94E47|nr:signal-induced proliferation-associated 1-like protein 2 isoform X2 [Leptopilina heterotoma]
MIASLPMNGGGGSGGPMSRVGRGLALHRSNSSLELPHSPDPASRIPETPLRREYGSHGSIDVVAQSVSVGDNLFSMLQDFRPPEQRSPSSDFMRRVQDVQSPDADEVCGPTGNSPKLRLKLNRLWGGKPPRGSEETCTSPVISADVEERHRRRAFAHYDCQSFTANLGYAAKLRGILLARRRNTATGASAASSLRSSTPDEAPEEDTGDGKGNDLLESCPFFRNETGGEGEREVGLTRCPNTNGIHRPPMAYGVSVLEPPPGETLWKHTCPLQKRLMPIESVDDGAYYYRRYFLGQEHQNWFGMDEQLGPVAISIRKDGTQYRIIVRTTELLTLRGTIPEEALGIRQQGKIPTRELLELVAPEVQMNCLRLGTPSSEPEVANVDEHGLTSRYKIGVLYCRAGQRTEEEMYNNQHAGPAFLEFLDTIGQRVRLRGYEGFKAGLDTRTDSTGTHAVVANHRGAEVTFHVSTMLPFTPNNRQQLLRKRHIGNDIVTIVFQEPGALPFSPRRIRSQFQHVFIIVRVTNPCSENTQYTVAISRNKEVPIFGPPVPVGASFPKGKAFADFILAKAINGENAAHKVEKFATMATRTRLEYLRNLATKYSSSSMVDTGQKFSMLSFSSKKKAVVRPRLPCDASQRGAICWQVILEDSNQSTDCYLGVSIDSIVLVEEHSRQIVFVTPCVGVLGWHAQTNRANEMFDFSLRLYYHQGECITIHVRGDCGERDELMEIVARLRAVTQGSPASELSLKRNNLGQLGFHVQPDGVVTQVEGMGFAWQAGLRQGSRLVEICKVAVSTLSHDQMVDLLKTSLQVTVTVIPPSSDGSPRRGCTLQKCQYLSGNYEGEYENVTTTENTPTQQTTIAQQKRYDRSFSPPRSSNSSGYGTGSSSRSFNDPRFPLEGTMTSSSSGHSSADDRWYELLEPQDQDHRRDETPPPLPARQNYQLGTPKGTPGLKKESHYSTGKQFLDSVRHHNHDHFAKESNYVSPRALQENIRQETYQRLENSHRSPDVRNQDHRSPDVRNQDHRSPDVRNQDHRSPDVRNQDHRSPDVRNQDHRSPDVRNQDHRSPDVRSQEHRNQEHRIYEIRNHDPRNNVERRNDSRSHEIHHNHNHEIRNQEHRNSEHISQSYVKQQKEKYEVKESAYASQREIHKNELHSHQKLGVSTSLPLVQNSSYSVAKSGSNNNLIRYNEYEQYNNETKADRNSKYEIYEEKRTKHEEEVVRQREKRTGYDFEETYERRGSKYESDLIRNELRFNEQQSAEGKHEDHEHVRDTKRYHEIPHEFKVGDKVTCLKTTMSERPVPHKVCIEYRPKDFITSLPPEMRVTDGNATDISTLPSEDELSNGSGSVSPRMRRANKHRTGNLTPSSGGSRNQSPRPKPGARNSYRNSANLTSSTLQEDLMKLINPDFISDDNQIVNNNFPANNQNTNNKVNNNILEIQNRCRSRENLCGNSTSTLSVLERNGQENGNASEVILTMARPATVISNASTASSPAPSENKMTKEERLSPRVTKTPHTITKPPSTLAAIRDAKIQLENEANGWPNHLDPSAKVTKHCQDWPEERIIDGNNSTNEVSDLHSHLSTLELRMARETRRRLSLEDEVRRLRDENRRLQDESHAAAQQLRLFTEWFFQNIDHQ